MSRVVPCGPSKSAREYSRIERDGSVTPSTYDFHVDCIDTREAMGEPADAACVFSETEQGRRRRRARNGLESDVEASSAARDRPDPGVHVQYRAPSDGIMDTNEFQSCHRQNGTIVLEVRLKERKTGFSI